MDTGDPTEEAGTRFGRKRGASRARYEIVVKGQLGEAWSDWFDGLALSELAGGEMLLSGTLPDQAALHGVLSMIGGLNLELVAVRKVASLEPEQTPAGETGTGT